MSQVQEFSTSPTCRNGFDIGVKNGSIAYIRQFWSSGANQRTFKGEPKKGEAKITLEMTKWALKEVILKGSPLDVKNLYLFLNKEGKEMMKEARKELILEIENLF